MKNVMAEIQTIVRVLMAALHHDDDREVALLDEKDDMLSMYHNMSDVSSCIFFHFFPVKEMIHEIIRVL